MKAGNFIYDRMNFPARMNFLAACREEGGCPEDSRRPKRFNFSAGAGGKLPKKSRLPSTRRTVTLSTPLLWASQLLYRFFLTFIHFNFSFFKEAFLFTNFSCSKIYVLVLPDSHFSRNGPATRTKPAKTGKLKHGPYNFLITALSCGFLLSCGQTPRQYELPSTVSPDGSINQTSTSAGGRYGKAAFLSDTPTRLEGGLPLNEKPAETESQKDGKIRANSLVPIKYQERSVGNINMDTLYEESLDILNFSHNRSSFSIYKEGLAVAWRDNPPRIPDIILILPSYQGPMDFGPSMKNNRQVRMGQSFADQFSLGESDILKDPKARQFITSLYKHLEEKEEDCLKNQSCSLSINPQGNFILFQLPKMTFLFGNNDRRKLVQIGMKRDDNSACFKSPLDLVTAQFACETADGSKIFFRLGDSYKEVLEKSGISRDLPITYRNTFLAQKTRSTFIIWKRNNFEEKVKSIPETSHLTAVLMDNHEYSLPFLINQSLVEISLTGRDTVRLRLEPLTTAGREWKMEDILKKTEAVKTDPSRFYLTTEMPQIRDNFILQKNLVKALLDLLEENHTQLHSGESSEIRIHKRVFGEHSDIFALESSGLLIVSRPKGPSENLKYPLLFRIDIDESSGRATFLVALADDDFESYVLENQIAGLDFSGPVQELLGFKLGDRVYLRDKKPGPGTAIVAYLTEGGQTLVTLAKYSDEEESPAVYPAGRDKNIIFEKSSAISVAGESVLLHIHPTSETKVIEGLTYDEYEISKISASGSSFFGEIQSLCGITGFDMAMGLYDRDFSKRLVDEIQKARTESQTAAGEKPFEDCFYIAPTDSSFSGVKRDFFFPKHNLILDFASRELNGLTIYRKPPANRGVSR